ncbi:hypothetical protein chiPu_0024916 [Chiloscyllium punctatum]|uniref:Uncharacterized protein n=1 Tax=Chiloscyllium punctatum TaxID=137246 RepID=A0A401TE49_CHIPU|nr:hypothetical protein [Chiloscyllium punctatum]
MCWGWGFSAVGKVGGADALRFPLTLFGPHAGSGTDPLRERAPSPEEASPRLADRLMEGVRPRRYKRLLERELCEGLESRIRHYAKRGRIALPAAMRLDGQEGGRPKEEDEEEEDDAAPTLPHPPR